MICYIPFENPFHDTFSQLGPITEDLLYNTWNIQHFMLANK